MSQSVSEPRAVRRAELVTWESAAWAITGLAWVVAAWPGLIVEWHGAGAVPAISIGALVLIGAWQVVHGASAVRPASWIASRTWRSNRRPPKPRQKLRTSVFIDSVLWAGSGVAWVVAARHFGWSETITGAMFQMGIGLALTAWAALGLLAAKAIRSSGDNTVVVRRRILGAGPMTVRRCRANQRP